MAISVDQSAVECAPGNAVAFSGSDLTNATAALTMQAATQDQTTTLTVFDNPDDQHLTVLIPDGARNGPLVITAADTSTATIPTSVSSQYVRADAYIGEGVDTSDLGVGELDAILRKASSYADTWMGMRFGLRYLQTAEQHAWRSFRDDKSRRIYPFRRNIISVDSFIVQISTQQQATFPPTDIIINQDQNYIEILSYAVASYTLLGNIQNLGLVANIVKLIYTAGFMIQDYPDALKQAVKMIATEMLTYRKIQSQGFGGFSSVKQANQQYDRRSESFSIPPPAKELLRPFVFRRLG